MNNAIALLKQSIELFTQNWKLFVGIALIPGILSFISGMFMSYTGTTTDGAMIALVALMQLAVAVIGILMSIALLRAIMQPTVTIGEAYKQSLPYFWWYLLLSIIIGVMVVLGLIVLIVPGVIIMVWFAFTHYALVVDNVKGFAAMKRSKELVTGRWWEVFGYMAFLLVISLAIGFVIGIAVALLESVLGALLAETVNFLVTIIISPIAIIYFYLLYQKLKSTVGAVSVPPTGAPENSSQAPAENTTPASAVQQGY